MRFNFLIVLWFLFFAGLPPVSLTGKQTGDSQESELPDVEDILDRYIDALGGELPIRGIESMMVKWEARSMTMNGRDALLPDPKIDFMWTEDRGWTMSSSQFRSGRSRGRFWQEVHGHETQWMSEEDASPMLYYENQVPANALLLRKSFLDGVISLKVVGTEEIDGREAYRVVDETETENQLVRFFDVESGLLVGSEVTIAMNKTRQFYEDFRDVDGVMMPYKSRYITTVEQMEIKMEGVIELTKIELNGEVDEELLAVPKVLLEQSNDK